MQLSIGEEHILYSAIIGRGKILANSLSQKIGGEIFGEFLI